MLPLSLGRSKPGILREHQSQSTVITFISYHGGNKQLLGETENETQPLPKETNKSPPTPDETACKVSFQNMKRSNAKKSSQQIYQKIQTKLMEQHGKNLNKYVQANQI